ncbi:MAG: phenylalanine--tRNA ligase subunit beta [Gammaproteobacteria bacterium]
MKVPYSWLREWVDVPWDARELGARLTMCGFELEAIEPAAPMFSGVVIAEILSAERHPQADKLQVCRVSTGQGEPLQIVCGASNARAGLKAALATVGAQLPGGLDIKAAKLRGVESFGMLASAKELGLAETSAGILALPPDAPLGRSLREYLALDDQVLDVNVMPNRGDAMSVLGVAREVAALSGRPVTGPPIDAVSAKHRDTFPVHLDAPAACPKFVGRVIRGVNNRATTPAGVRERLRRAGVRSISPIVDAANYVLLELGQPMHAYDLAKLDREIRVRYATAGEACTLLDGRTVTADTDVLVIADRAGPVGLAGIMGGERTAVSEATSDVFLEVAFFSPDAIAGRARRFGLVTDASQRFERGVDPSGQERAIERATALIQSIAGGSPRPVSTTQHAAALPKRSAVPLRRSQLARLLGATIEPGKVESTLKALQMRVERTGDGWSVVPPSHRFDVTIEADLIDEVARIVGFDAIAEADAHITHHFRRVSEERPPERTVLEALAARGYQEAITFAFVDPALQSKLFPDRPGLALANPISSDLSVMRVSLWPGLLRAARENLHRQQDRVRLFEHGASFDVDGTATREVDLLSGIALGPRVAEQWGLPREMRVPTDFYDVKADVESLLAATGDADAMRFDAASLPSLHPGRAARITRDGAPVGWIGELHPALVRELDFTYAPVLFELEFYAALRVRVPSLREVSRFPHVRRDLAIVVDEDVALSALRERVTLAASQLLQSFLVFDVYRGPGVESGRKSVALGLIFQGKSRTLTDVEADRAVADIVADLRESLNARVRE